MANIKSAKKRILVNEKKALRNQMVKSQIMKIQVVRHQAMEEIRAVATQVVAEEQPAQQVMYSVQNVKIWQSLLNRAMYLAQPEHQRQAILQKLSFGCW